MKQSEWLAKQFEAHRTHLRAVAYRMLGSLSDADDAVQEAWLRLSSSEAGAVANLGGWLTTVVARICLDMLRSSKSRREDPFGVHVPDPIVSREDGIGPEHEALVADAVGLALLVVLETLSPAERLAFVLHDMFAMPFDEIAPIVGRTLSATRKLASRARRRVQGAARTPDADLTCQREVVDAFLAAARGGDLDALLAVLDPDIVLVAEGGGAPPGAVRELHGARTIAEQALTYSRLVESARPVLVNGAAGIVSWLPGGKLFSVMGFTVRNGKIVEIDILADPARLRHLDLAALDDRGERDASVAGILHGESRSGGVS
jgi:RNA polymerase sigma-70 factor, ECF subfamily